MSLISVAFFNTGIWLVVLINMKRHKLLRSGRNLTNRRAHDRRYNQRAFTIDSEHHRVKKSMCEKGWNTQNLRSGPEGEDSPWPDPSGQGEIMTIALRALCDLGF